MLVRSCVFVGVWLCTELQSRYKSTCAQSCWCCDVNALTVLGLYTPVRKPLSQRCSSSQVLGTVRCFKKSCCAMWTDLVRSERHTFPSLLEVLHGRNRVKFLPQLQEAGVKSAYDKESGSRSVLVSIVGDVASSEKLLKTLCGATSC